jgi:uncharacterized membrane protein
MNTLYIILLILVIKFSENFNKIDVILFCVIFTAIIELYIAYKKSK